MGVAGPIEPFYLGVAERIREARRQAGWSQEALARAIGRQRLAIVMIETGRNRVSLQDFVGIAKALDVPIAQLLGQAADDQQRQIRAAQARASAQLQAAARQFDSAREALAKALDALPGPPP